MVTCPVIYMKTMLITCDMYCMRVLRLHCESKRQQRDSHLIANDKNDVVACYSICYNMNAIRWIVDSLPLFEDLIHSTSGTTGNNLLWSVKNEK